MDLHVEIATPVKIAQNEGSAVLDAAKDLVFGSIAGIVAKVFEFPFDTVKVRLQSQPDNLPLRYKGPLDCIKQSIAQDGIRGLYRGISPPLVGAAAENSALFFCYSISQNVVRRYFLPAEYSDNKDLKLPIGSLAICGAISGSFTSLVLTPIELIKCKMQVQPTFGARSSLPLSPTTAALTGKVAIHTLTIPRQPGPITLIKDIVRAYGITGLWHGQMGTFFRESGGSAAWFGAYEYSSAKLCAWGNKEKASSIDQMLAGALAGVSYNFLFFPADSVKSKMQTEAISTQERPKGFWEVGRGMCKAHGLKALYRGCGITCMRSAPSSALIFLCVETLQETFKNLGK